MLYSKLAGKTKREVPQLKKDDSFYLLVQAGYVQSLGKGLHSFLPLGMRVLKNISEMIRLHMEPLGGQEVLIPLVNPVDIWRKSGRLELMSRDIIRFHDKNGRDLILSPTHEEAMVELIRDNVHSYRDLPLFLFQIQSKYRDETKTKGGLIRSKEFIMKDGYSFHKSFSDLNNFFPKVFAAYRKFFKSCDLDVIEAESGVGFMRGNKAYEFLVPCSYGDNTLIQCPNCGYAANQDVALSEKHFSVQVLKPLEKVETKDCITMETLSERLEVDKDQLAKPLVYSSTRGLVMVLVRGDYEVSEEKLSAFLGYPVGSLASKRELRTEGLIPGYMSPINLEIDIPVVVDELVANSSNLIYGANERDYHYLNGNFGRDFESPYVADIARVHAGDLCKSCGRELVENKVVEVANIFKLSDYYTRTMDVTYQGDDGKKKYPYMGSYGIGISRLVSVLVDKNKDDKGIGWPLNLAPYKVGLVAIGHSLRIKDVAQSIYKQLERECLFDDREESVGVKFKDLDLIGIPLRIVVSSDSLKEGMVEFKERSSGRTWLVAVDDVLSTVKQFFGEQNWSSN
ncbi:proline--tRNA ligase [Spirochaeta cellobiosiphila]|uniref:proline--tRNA ligase n=1 Tax=Spirochaeta cellobiosiphila TaxID=504483 RepID=UPI000409FFB8|nr:proline--tRNA ligase [Spirochaeta cellobiosiphila]